MKTFVQAIQEAEKFSTKVEKFNALSNMDPLSIKLVEQALNPYRVFNVRKWEKPTYSNHDDSYQPFLDMLDCLHNRQWTGNAARELVSQILSKYTENTAKYLSRVLNKNLDCGATVTTFEKIYPNLNVPKFE